MSPFFCVYEVYKSSRRYPTRLYDKPIEFNRVYNRYLAAASATTARVVVISAAAEEKD